MRKLILTAGLCAAMLSAFAASCGSSGITTPNLVTIADSVLIDSLATHGAVDSSLSYFTKANYDSLFIYPVGVDTLKFSTFDPMIWTSTILMDTTLDSIVYQSNTYKNVNISATINFRLLSSKLAGPGTLSETAARADSFSVGISNFLINHLIPLPDTSKSVILTNDSTVYWLLLRGTSGKAYLSGNTKLLTNPQQTLMALFGL